MRPAIAAGALYFLAAFAAGFVLGALRVTTIVPRMGELAAVLLELPLMLAASWWFSRRILAHRTPEFSRNQALAMGAAAFVMLMAAETLLGLTAFSRPLAEQWHRLLTPQGALGLSGQVAFALIPWFQTQIRQPRHS